MIALQNRQYLSVITTTGADIHVSVSTEDDGLGRGHAHNVPTVITAAVASPGTSIHPVPDSPSAAWKVKNITIRNIDTTSQTVTVCLVIVADDGTQTVLQLYKETIATGQELVYEERAGWLLATHNTIGVWTTAILSAPVVEAATTLTNVLTAAMLSGLTYEFSFKAGYTSTATTNGSRWVYHGIALTALNGTSRYTLTATSQTVNYFTAADIPAAANATSLTVGNVVEINGFITPSADGTFAIQVASENAAGDSITVLAGAVLMIRRVL